METCIIVGAGKAGASAAEGLRTGGFDGRILLIGDEPYAPYERPPLSKSVLVSDERHPTYHHEPGRYEELEIEYRGGARVERIDTGKRLLQIRSAGVESWDRLILATGSRARRLAIPGGETCHVVRNFDDALVLRAKLGRGVRAVCIGAGVIGLEVASSARSLGCDVTVVDPADRVMSRSLPDAMAAMLRSKHEEAGIRFLFGSRPAAVADRRVSLSDGTALEADVVICGVGICRNTELAVAGGIKLNEGILVDDRGETSVKGIFAAGEVAEFPVAGGERTVVSETWRHAVEHGALVGRAAAGEAVSYRYTPWFWTDQLGMNIQVAGTFSPDMAIVRRLGGTGAGPMFLGIDAEGRMMAAGGFDAASEMGAAMRVIKRGKPVDRAHLERVDVPLRAILAGKVVE
ncbi:pyridine nucleotide-disulfide oxidoreductase [bacterium]|nr:pyridine nucleotide-disulfide oxidoreductase [bacterium]